MTFNTLNMFIYFKKNLANKINTTIVDFCPASERLQKRRCIDTLLPPEGCQASPIPSPALSGPNPCFAGAGSLYQPRRSNGAIRAFTVRRSVQHIISSFGKMEEANSELLSVKMDQQKFDHHRRIVLVCRICTPMSRWQFQQGLCLIWHWRQFHNEYYQSHRRIHNFTSITNRRIAVLCFPFWGLAGDWK